MFLDTFILNVAHGTSVNELQEFGFVLTKCLRYLASDWSAGFSYNITILSWRPPAQNPVFRSPLARGMVLLIDIRSYRHPQLEPSSLNGCAGKSSVLLNQECNLSCADRKQIDHFGPHSWIWSSPSPPGKTFQHDAVKFQNVPVCGVLI